MQGFIRLTLSFPRSHFSPQLVVIEIWLANLLLWIWVQTMLLVSMCRVMVTHWKNYFIWHWYCGCNHSWEFKGFPSLILALLWSKSQILPTSEIHFFVGWSWEFEIESGQHLKFYYNFNLYSGCCSHLPSSVAAHLRSLGEYKET